MERQLVELEGNARFWLEKPADNEGLDTLRRWWRALVEGELDLADGFSTESETFLALKQPRQRRAPLSARQVEVLERIILGERAKVLALDYDVSASTVAALIKRALQQLGWNERAVALPVGLLILSEAARGVLPPRLRLYSGSLPDGSPCHVLAAPLAPLAGVLSNAVREVVRLHVEGKSYSEIAARRATSTRTVANQVSTAFRILRVSGRGELRHYLAVGTPSP
jgi:DNA-binding NarL/FixJ family response regulator